MTEESSRIRRARLSSWVCKKLLNGGGFEAVGGEVLRGGGELGDARLRVTLRDGGVRFRAGFGRERSDRLIATGVLRFVKSAVGEAQNLFVVHVNGRGYRPREGGPANRNGAVHCEPRAFYLERFAGDRGKNARGKSGGFFAFAETRDDEKFLAAPADENVGIANGGANAIGEFNEHLVARVVAEAVVDVLKVVGVDEIENDVAIATALGGIWRRVATNGLADVALNGGLEKSAIARGSERIGEGHLLELFVGEGEGFAALGDRFFQAGAFALEFASAVVREAVESEKQEQRRKSAGIPALPPRRNNGERKFGGKTESAARGAAGNGKPVVARRKCGIASFAAGGVVRVGLEAGEAIAAVHVFRVAVGQRGKLDAESVVAALSGWITLGNAFARAENSGSNDHARRQLDGFVGGSRIVTRQAAAGAEEQGAVCFSEKTGFAEVVPDETVGAGEALCTAVAQKLGEAKGASGPDIAVVIGAEHIDVERRETFGEAEVCDARFTLIESQAGQAESVIVAEPNFIAADGGGFDDVLLAQAVAGGKVEPVLAVEAREPAAANGPQHTIGAATKTADSAVNLRRHGNVHESKRPLGETNGFDVVSIRNPEAAIGSAGNARGNRLGSGDFYRRERIRIEARDAAGRAENPDGAVGGEDQIARDAAVEAVFGFPDTPTVSLGIPHGDTAVRADPQAVVLVANFRPHDIVGEAFRGGPSRPGLSANPALDARATEADPVSALAVLGDSKGGVNGHSAILINNFPLPGDAAVEAFDGGNEEIAGVIESGSAVIIGGRERRELLGKNRRAGIEAIEMSGGAYPNYFLEVLENADDRLARQSGFHGKKVNVVLRIEPTDAVTRGEPDAPFRGDVDSFQIETGHAFGQGPQARVVQTIRVNAEQADVSREIDFAPGIESEGRRVAERADIFGKVKAMERAAFQVRDSAAGDNPHAAGGREDELADVRAGEALLEAEAQNAVAVKAEQAVAGADPHETFLILKDAGGRNRTQSKVFADALKGVVRMARQRKDKRLG